MDCDYCGLATGAVAVWEVTAGPWPGDNTTRYVCDEHRAAAEGIVGQAGEVRVFPANGTYLDTRTAA